MAYDRQEYEEHLAQDRLERLALQRAGLERSAQAEVAAGILTHDTHWDTFLQIVQAQINMHESRRDANLQQMLDPTKTAEELAMLRAEAMLAKQSASILNWMLDIPKSLKEQGEKARKLVDELDARAEPS